MHLDYFYAVITWQYWLSMKSGTYPTNGKPIAEAAKVDLGRYEKFTKYIKMWPGWNQLLAKIMVRDNLTSTTAAKLSLEIGNYSDDLSHAQIILDLESQTALSTPILTPYITVHHGFDSRFLPGREGKPDYNSTKNLPLSTWVEIVAAIKKSGVMTVQLGTISEEKIPGVDLYLNGKTTVPESALILKGGLCHVDTEGGLVHLAHTLRQPSVVMFGPTPVDFFGYAENINLEPQGCKACWYATVNWLVECPRKTPGPECMAEHRQEQVIEGINEILRRRPPIKAQVLNSIKIEDKARLINQFRSNYPENFDAKNRLGFAIFDMEDGFSQENLNFVSGRAEKNIFIISPAAELMARAKTFKGMVASPLNLPLEDASTTLITCVSKAWTTREAPFLLREILRVLKPNGVLMAAVPMESKAEISLETLFKLSGLADDGVILKQNMANFFSLKKLHGEPFQITVEPNPKVQDVNLIAERQVEIPGFSASDLINEISSLEGEIEANYDVAFDLCETRYALADQSWEAVTKAVRSATRQHGWIECRSNFCDDYSRHFLLKGWSGTEDWGCWSVGHASQILLPLNPAIEDDETLEIELDFTVLQRERPAPVTLTLTMANQPISVVSCEAENLVSIEIPASRVDCAAYGLLSLEVSSTTRPSLWGLNANDHRELGIGLRRFRYRTFGKPMQEQLPKPLPTSKQRRFPFFI